MSNWSTVAMRWALAGGLLVGAGACALPQSIVTVPCPQRFRSAQEFIRGAVRAGRAPGIAIGMVERGEVVWCEGFGVADTAGRRPVTPRSEFALRGVSEWVTAATVLQVLAEQKRRSGTPILECLPGALQVETLDQSAKELTVWEVLRHKGGLPEYREAFGSRDEVPGLDEVLRAQRRIAYLGDSEWRTPPTDFGYILAARALQHLTQTPWHEVVVDRLLRPLGMERTRLVPTKPARYYDKSGEARPHRWSSDQPGRGFWSSAEDMTRLLQLQLGVGGHTDTIAKSVRARLYRCVFDRLIDLEPTPHGRRDEGCCVRLYPEEEVGLVVFGNGSDALLTEIADRVHRVFGSVEEPMGSAVGFGQAGLTASSSWRGTLSRGGLSVPVTLDLDLHEDKTVRIAFELDGAPCAVSDQRVGDYEIIYQVPCGADQVKVLGLRKPASLKVHVVRYRDYVGERSGKVNRNRWIGHASARGEGFVLPFTMDLRRVE